MKCKYPFVLCFILCYNIIDVISSNIIARTSKGLISGLELLDYNNNMYYAFQSVPYAQPPLGNLRFRPPKEPQPWLGIKDGTKASPTCPQSYGTLFLGQEDCLYLNVYTKSVS